MLYEKAHHNTLHHRLIHEMLHVLGITEEDMPSVICSACVYSHDKAREFVDELLRNCTDMYELFKQRVRTIQEANPELTQKMGELSNLLYQNKAFCQPINEDYHILFM